MKIRASQGNQDQNLVYQKTAAAHRSIRTETLAI